MFKKVITLSLVALTSVFCGCASWWTEVLTNEQKVAQVATTVECVANTTVSLVVAKNPDLAQWFLLGSEVIQLAVNDGKTKPTEILALVDAELEKKGCVPEMRTAINAAITTSINLYTVFYQVNINSKIEDVGQGYITILRAMCHGIDTACGKYSSTVSLQPVKSYKPVEEYTIQDLQLK